MVQTHDNLVLVYIRSRRRTESEHFCFVLEESLEAFLHVVEVEIVEIACWQLVRTSAAPSLIPEDDEVVGLHTSRLRPSVLVLGVAFCIKQSVWIPWVQPLIRNIHTLLCKSIHVC